MHSTVQYNNIFSRICDLFCLSGTHWVYPEKLHFYSNSHYTHLISSFTSFLLEKLLVVSQGHAWWNYNYSFFMEKKNDVRKTKLFYAMWECNQLGTGWTWTHVPSQVSVNGLQHIWQTVCLQWHLLSLPSGTQFSEYN